MDGLNVPPDTHPSKGKGQAESVLAVVDVKDTDDKRKVPPQTISRTHSSHLETDRGTVHVRPVTNASAKQLRALVSFTPRASHFDRENATSAMDTFRGFYTLFWIASAMMVIRTFVESYEQTGSILGLTFGTLISRDAKTLALSDAVLVGSMFLCVPFVKLLERGWIRYNPTGMIIQHILQGVYLAIAVMWTFKRNWPWVQAGFFTLHALTMLMKIHSYLATNGYMATLRAQLRSTEARLRKLVETSGGGWEHAVSVSTAASRASTSSSTATPEPTSMGKDLVDAASSSLRQRAVSPTDSGTQTPVTAMAPAHAKTSDLPEHPLVHHPDSRVADLAREVEELKAELTSKGPNKVVWPQSISYYNFADYLIVPTLVYELEYPRTDKIRPAYVLEKTLATFGTFTLLYIITEHYISPKMPRPDQSFARTMLDLSLPFMLNYVLIFYIIFECICNAFAEISCFADREFYQDWWNATSWDQFARKWNKPVHVFLLRHVYASTMATYKISKQSATLITFLLSSLVHELVMAVVTKKIRMYLFVLQMAQLPMIAIGRIPAVKRRKTIGNIVFWLGLMAGPPLLAVGYILW